MGNKRYILMSILCVLAAFQSALWGSELQPENSDSNAELRALIDDIASPIIGFDPVGNAIAVWYDRGPERYAIYAARYVYNIGWQPKVILSNDVNVSAPQIAFDDMGNAFVLWYEDNGMGTSNIFVARYVMGSGWKPKVNLSSTTMRATNPEIAVDSAGNAAVVWREIIIGGYTVYAARFLVNGGWQAKIKLSY